MYFDKQYIQKHKTIKINDLYGYVLPHASVKYCGEIISHTLRFLPKRKIKNIILIYYPTGDIDINGKYYHEFYVPYMSLKMFFPNVKFINFNLKEKDSLEFKKNLKKINNLSIKNTLYVVSADFSHRLTLQEAIEKENCSAKALSFRNLDENLECLKIVDDVISFEFLFQILPKNFYLDWIGRTRSDGERGIGYLTFLIKKKKNKYKKPDAFFVTVYDVKMNARECQGNLNEWNEKLESELIEKVKYLSETTSRLTGGVNKDIPTKFYTITYMYKEPRNRKFIRGYHTIKKDAVYLSEVFLENTYENGKWIKSTDIEWNHNNNNFKLNNTFNKLSLKSGKFNNKKTKKRNYTLYRNIKINKQF